MTAGNPPSPAPGFPQPADEGRHRDVPLELWSFALGHPGLERRLVVHLTLVPGEQRAAVAAAVRLAPTRAVVVVADELLLPARGLELRGPGIWADHNVEEPLRRWSLGLEAFGVAVDIDPGTDLDVVLAAGGAPDLRGDREPLGWDLEWTSVAPPVVDGPSAYRVECRVEGELLTAAGGEELDGPGERSHRW